MKTKEIETSFDIFENYTLTTEEMTTVRGGEGDIHPTNPPIKI
jgi:hypothetical protein